ncbi:hypothetical protein ASPACDRAFT_1889621 [Aspergillus aculeatus ATCC 16872]|uniref:Fumarylacetoacetase-like C-terminal domain-containing protein n=1 Tax=Aspergillus aculeatus (strain ATCC 16872 / CBS 172.66 / WB 5094) TaxID=690307 RepID=A0A1L9WQF4_ASPA1|nr:uncharacterized protein ASPACDRAFT_1889621 [Aspergillus aculeatus ATCC 16872]OJJ98425.1 hypothetical protein ASPACDRAFT_1889621 [Aspergillus aculeatus ATCC 16872]
MPLSWKRLIRFGALDGRILRGEPILPAKREMDLGQITEANQLQARVLQGEDIYDTTPDQAPSDVPILRCVGLNYAKHIPCQIPIESNSCGTMSGHRQRRQKRASGARSRWGFSKGFDTFAPLGPVLVSEIPAPAQLHLKTIVDGEMCQNETVGDSLFDCAYLVSYLSQGTTLQKGSVIMAQRTGLRRVSAGLATARVRDNLLRVRVHAQHRPGLLDASAPARDGAVSGVD